MSLLPSVSKDYDRKSAVICAVYIPDLCDIVFRDSGGVSLPPKGKLRFVCIVKSLTYTESAQSRRELPIWHEFPFPGFGTSSQCLKSFHSRR